MAFPTMPQLMLNARISAADQAKYNVQYIEKQVGYWTKYNVFDYSFTAKYGENIVPGLAADWMGGK